MSQLARGRPTLRSGAPSDAIEEARASAQAGVSLAALLQRYRIGQAVAWDAILDAVTAIDGLDDKGPPTCCACAPTTASPSSKRSSRPSRRSTCASATGS